MLVISTTIIVVSAFVRVKKDFYVLQFVLHKT